MDIDEVMDIGEGKPRRYEPERRCGAHLRGGEGTCRLPAGHGTDHVGWGQCRKHGGNTATARRHAYHLQALAEMPVMGGEIDVDPIDSLLACIGARPAEWPGCGCGLRRWIPRRTSSRCRVDARRSWLGWRGSRTPSRLSARCARGWV